MPSILVADIAEKSQFFITSNQSETIVNLGSLINSLSIDLYWQLSGQPFYDSVPLKEISWAVIINGSLSRGVERCLI